MKKMLPLVVAFVILICGILCLFLLQSFENKEIIEIPVESVKGISAAEAEDLCYNALGKADKETGFLFSFGVSGAVKKGRTKFYTIRASWLVNNSHLSYIGDFFVSADGKRIYTGEVFMGEYKIEKLVWEK